MTLPQMPFGNFSKPEWFSEEHLIRYYKCPKCGVVWELERLYQTNLLPDASEGYYLSLQHEDTMEWIGELKADPNTIQAVARNKMVSHSCFQESKSGGCGGVLLIIFIIWLVASIGGSGLLRILGIVESIATVIWVAFLIAIFLSIATLVVLGIIKIINFFKGENSGGSFPQFPWGRK